MEYEELTSLPEMTMQQALLTISHTPKNKATLVTKQFPREKIQKVNRINSFFLEQIRGLIDGSIYMQIIPEGIVARIEADQVELTQASIEIIQHCSSIAHSMQINIDKSLQDIFAVQDEQPHNYGHSLRALRALDAVDERRAILDKAKEHIVTVDEMRVQGLIQARLDAYWRTLNSSIRDPVQSATVIADYAETAQSVFQSLKEIKTLLFSTRVLHGRYFQRKAD